MQHLASPEQPAFLAQNENDAYMLEYVAREHVGSVALTQQVKRYRQAAISGKPEAAQQAFFGREAALLLDGLAHVINVVPETNHRFGMAQDMIDSYEASLAEATAGQDPRLVVAA